jgi:hypothetical protein
MCGSTACMHGTLRRGEDRRGEARSGEIFIAILV